MVVANKGAYISGAAGVGKTTLIKQIKEQIIEEDPSAHIISMAVAHVAARLAQGCTRSHALRRFAKVRNAWIFIDECSQVPLGMLGEISRWRLVGCKFIIVEDRIGQFLPIYDTWDTDLRMLPESTLMKDMCECMRIRLVTYKRGQDPSLFNFYHGLYSTDVDDQTLVQFNVSKARCQFEKQYVRDIDMHHYFVLSHSKGGPQEPEGRQLAVFVYRDGQLYCICTMS